MTKPARRRIGVTGVSLMPRDARPDVLIIGGGNAGLCAALVAAEAGAAVVVAESAPKDYRGGNSRHTRNFRCMHESPIGALRGRYDADEYFDDLLQVTGGNTDEQLARMCIHESAGLYRWMESRGARFQPALSGALSLARTNAFFLGGGKALLNAYYRRAESLGVRVLYDATVTHLQVDGARITSARVEVNGESVELTPRAVVAASGGFQADLDWLASAWGPAARNFLIRGTPYNRGVVLRDLLRQGAVSVGDAAQCHAVAIDGRAPKFDGGIATRLDCVPFAAVVNQNGERFYDEGEDVWPKRYAIWGRLVAAQPAQVAYAIIDSKAIDLFMPSVFAPVESDSVEGLARKMNLPAAQVMQTIDAFNAACRPGEFKPTELDRLATAGITPRKSNWARPIDSPPFYGYELRPGVTFTYLGLKVDENARVQSAHGAMENLWAAGEIMAGSLLGKGYLAGFGMTIGTVFGKLAGRGAAAHAK